jgi:hypothetical protein
LLEAEFGVVEGAPEGADEDAAEALSLREPRATVPERL